MRMSSRTRFLASLAVASLAWATARADERPDSKGDVAAVRAAGKEYVTKLRCGDADGLRKMWTREGDYVDAAGRRFKASELFSGGTDAKSSGQETAELPTSDSTIRIVAPGVAIEDGTTESEVADDDGMVASCFTAVWVKRDGCWRIDSLREVADAPVAASDRLQSLAWLIGEWAAKTDDSVILVSSRWSDDGHYIIREFVERGGGSAVSATQRIGWDAASGTIKCWTFDSQGGSGTGSWRHDGNRWIVEATEAMPDGSKVIASTVYTPGDEGHFVWEAAGAKVSGRDVPRRRVEFKRAIEK